MVMPFEISGSLTSIPGVYDSLRIQGSLPSPVPNGRSVFIFGEAEEGTPGNLLDQRLNFFTNFKDVKDFYTAGPIVDAARMLFTNQPSREFGGAVNRLYINKTNQSLRASKAIVSPANFGNLVAFRYGEGGNFIKSQIKAVSEVLFSKTVSYLPSTAARSFSASVNGTVTSGLSQAALNVVTPAGTPATFTTLLGGVTGLSATGGTAKPAITGGTITATVTATQDRLTVTKASGSGVWGATGAAGDTFVIPPSSTLAGASSANAGVYLVVTWTSTSIVLRHIKSLGVSSEVSAAAFDTTGPFAALAVADSGLYSSVTIAQTATAGTGMGASLELSATAGALAGPGLAFAYGDLKDSLSAAGAATGSMTVTSSTTSLTITLSNASYSVIPKAGDTLRIARGSLIAGSTLANVGLWVVRTATPQTIVVDSAFGLTGVAVTTTPLAGSTSPFQTTAGFVSNTNGTVRKDSVQEAQVYLAASKTDTGTQFPATKVGGTVALELGYWVSGATACTATIDSNRVLTVSPTGSGLTPFTVNTNKYKTLQALADYLNTQAGMFARVPNPAYKSLPANVLDMVTSMGIIGDFSAASAPGRLKKDYYDWKTFFSSNTGLLAFQEGTMVLKAGLPDAEATASYLTGAVVGSTSDADIQDALDAGLKIDVRIIVPLFSRDARYDVSDGLTDAAGSYSIDSTLTACQAHVETASSSLFKKERIGQVSFYGDFQDSITKVGELAESRLQLAFQLFNALDGNGALGWKLPYMASCAVAAGRAQAVNGTSMLRKSFLFNDVKHIGNVSIFSDTLDIQFDPEDNSPGGQLDSAITAGLSVFRSVPGFGVRMESPDLSTLSRVNSDTAYYDERINIIFAVDSARQTLRSVLEAYIGRRQTDVPTATVKKAANDALGVFVTDGSMVTAQCLSILRSGNTYTGQTKLVPTETLEAIIIEETVERAPVG